MNAMRIASRRMSTPNFSEWRPVIHVSVVGDLPDVVDAIDERLLRIAERRVAAAEESADHERRQAGAPAGLVLAKLMP